MIDYSNSSQFFSNIRLGIEILELFSIVLFLNTNSHHDESPIFYSETILAGHSLQHVCDAAVVANV
jgi:hypothetical protein